MLCGQAYAGKIAESTSATDSAFADQTLVMHVRACGENEIKIPFHVGENRSRTWVITRTATGLRLKHDHRHEDGTADKITQYGGDTATVGTATQQDFPADTLTAQINSADGTQVAAATIDFSEGETFATVTVQTTAPGLLSPGSHGLHIHAVGKCEINSVAPTGGVRKKRRSTG